MPTSAYLAGLAGNAVANAALQLVIVILAGHFLLGVAWPLDWGSMAVFAAAGVVCFTFLGVALAHAIPNPESAPAYVNAVFLPQILIAGVFYDAAEAPQIIRDIAQALPLTHLVEGLSGAMIDGESVGANSGLAARSSACGARSAAILAVRGFSWEARRDPVTLHAVRLRTIGSANEHPPSSKERDDGLIRLDAVRRRARDRGRTRSDHPHSPAFPARGPRSSSAEHSG